MNLRNLLLRDGNPKFRKHHFRRITIPRTGIHPSPQFPQQRHASLHHKRQHISTPSMVIMPWASAFHGVLGFMHPQSSCYNFISIHNKISKKVNNESSRPRFSCKPAPPAKKQRREQSPSHPRSKRFHRLSLIACPSSPIFTIHPCLLSSLSPSPVPLFSSKVAPGLPSSQRCDAPSPYTYKKSRNPHPR